MFLLQMQTHSSVSKHLSRSTQLLSPNSFKRAFRVPRATLQCHDMLKAIIEFKTFAYDFKPLFLSLNSVCNLCKDTDESSIQYSCQGLLSVLSNHKQEMLSQLFRNLKCCVWWNVFFYVLFSVKNVIEMCFVKCVYWNVFTEMSLCFGPQGHCWLQHHKLPCFLFLIGEEWSYFQTTITFCELSEQMRNYSAVTHVICYLYLPGGGR